MKRLGYWLFYWAPPLVWAAGIFGLSCLSRPPRPPAYPGEDKVVHFLLFGILALLMYRALTGDLRLALRRALLLAWLTTSAYGAFDEVHQTFTPGRHVDWVDWLADTLGAAAALLILAGMTRFTARRASACARAPAVPEQGGRS